MTKKEKAVEIKKILDRLYPEPAIPLKHSSKFTLLVAVLLSAQCTDERVNKITPALFKKAKNPEEMAKLSVKEIEDIIRPCGLAPRKAKAISELSKILLNSHGGKVPGNIDELEKLPGVGHKTASVVMIQGFKQPAFPVDTHIHRLAYRWGLSNGKNVENTEKDLKKLFDKKDWARLHLQIIYYGREYCPARNFDPEKCEITKKFGRASLFK